MKDDEEEKDCEPRRKMINWMRRLDKSFHIYATPHHTAPHHTTPQHGTAEQSTAQLAQHSTPS